MSTEPIWAPSTSSRSPPSWPLGNTSTVILPPERSSTISLNFTDAMSAKPSGAPEWPTFNVNSGNASTSAGGAGAAGAGSGDGAGGGGSGVAEGSTGAGGGVVVVSPPSPPHAAATRTVARTRAPNLRTGLPPIGCNVRQRPWRPVKTRTGYRLALGLLAMPGPVRLRPRPPTLRWCRRIGDRSRRRRRPPGTPVPVAVISRRGSTRCSSPTRTRTGCTPRPARAARSSGATPSRPGS